MAHLDPQIQESLLKSLGSDETANLEYVWGYWARPDQLRPQTDREDWFVWLLEGGRGGGKTKAAAEFVRDKIESGEWRHPALIGRTAQDVRKVIVEDFEGGPKSGLYQICPPWNKPTYNPGTLRLSWTNPNYKSYGATAELYSAEIEELRGPGHDGAWCDEIAAWRWRGAWDNLLFTLRSGMKPQVVVSTTPKPTPLYKGIRKDPGTVITRFSTFANRENLAPIFFDRVIAPLMGTRLGRQEIEAEMMEDVEGALWTLKMIEAARVQVCPPLDHVFIGVDPPAKDREDEDVTEEEKRLNAECGIVAAGIRRGTERTDGRVAPPHSYVTGDYSMMGRPEEWGHAVVEAFRREMADGVVAEANQGGAMVRAVIHSVDRNVPVQLVHASRGKRTRAEPISSIYEQGRVHHVGYFADLESQMCSWVPGEKSPDRMDALVWAATKLLIGIPRSVGQLAGRNRSE